MVVLKIVNYTNVVDEAAARAEELVSVCLG